MIGTVVAVVLGAQMARLMDEEHDFGKGLLSNSFKTRKHRTADGGSVENWSSSRYFINKDSLAIFYRSWLPTPVAQPNIRAIVILSHGLAEHSGRYEELGLALAAKGMAVYALDHQGHGQSEGTRVYVKSFKDFISDVHQLTELAKKRHPTTKKVFLLGHSMGALISVHSANDAPRLYDGVVLSAPPLKLDLDPVTRKAAAFISSLLPKLGGPGLDVSTLCHDVSVVDRYNNDPLIGMGPQTFRITNELIKAIDDVPKFAPKFAVPYLLMHGTSDKMCMYEGSVEFDAKTISKDKKFVSFKGNFHELYNEPDRMERAFAETISWLEERI